MDKELHSGLVHHTAISKYNLNTLLFQRGRNSRKKPPIFQDRTAMKLQVFQGWARCYEPWQNNVRVECCAQWCRSEVDWRLVHRDRVATVNCSTRPCPRGGYSRPLVQVTWPHSFTSLTATSPRRSPLPVTRSTVKKAVLQRWPRLQYNNCTSVPAGTEVTGSFAMCTGRTNALSCI